MTKVLWAPWRMEFIEGAHKPSKTCVFCELPKCGTSKKNLVLYQGKGAYIILNRYPYSHGHILVIPHRHIGKFELLKTAEHAELGELVSKSLEILKKAFKAQGFNVGLNLGRVAGAGITKHIHYHIVPRWIGDSNFMPVLGETRMMPDHLLNVYDKLKKYFS